MVTLRKEKRIYQKTLRRILLAKRNFSERICREKLFFKHFYPENSVVYEIMWKNTLQTDSEHVIYYGTWAC